MKTKYPIILAHGIVLRDFKFYKSFGKIEKVLKNAGYAIYTSNTDGFGTVENNAGQLKAQIDEILLAEGADKVNIIAHSKGGLDAVHMITKLGTEDKVASLTTLCTPHRGSEIATKISGLPEIIKRFVAFWLDFWYKVFGDKKPDALAVCEQLKKLPATDEPAMNISDKVYCQSYSATVEKSTEDFVMGIPLMFSKLFEKDKTDGLVSVESAKFGNYRGNCGNISHSEIVGFMTRKKKRQKVYAFYLDICAELSAIGF